MDNHIISQLREEIQEINQISAETKTPPIRVNYDSALSFSDLGNAERMIQRHGLNMRFCFAWNRWLTWDGKRWVKDETGAIVRYAKETAKSLYADAAVISDPKDLREFLRHALRSESDNRIKAMINLAQSEPGIPVKTDELDRDPWLFNCPNGTVDLRTGVLLPHSRNHLITKISPVEYSASAVCPNWEAFLDRIMSGNQNLISFLQMAIGYCLTGDTREQCLFILYGSGANGKSTLINTMSSLLGDYAQQTPVNTLMIKQNDGVPNDIARLKGARFVAAVEAEEGRQLAENMIKQLTGGDIITARFMRSEFFEFKPEFKIFLATNHKPEIKGTDAGIWRRIRLIPFNVCIPPDEQDKDLQNKLKAELPGILRWALEGCIAWQQCGLETPIEIEEAVLEYRAEMDHVSAFFRERCKFDPLERVLASTLTSKYEEWCRDCQVELLNPKQFAARLRENGCSPIKMGATSQRGWKGVNLRLAPVDKVG